VPDYATPRSYITGIIIAMFFVIGGVALINEMREDNSSFDAGDRTGEFNRTFNKLDDVSTEVNTLEDNIKNSDDDFGVFGVLNSLIFSSWTTIKLLFTSFNFMDDVLGGLTDVFGVPAWIPLIIGLLITTMIVFAIYRMIFQTE